ncbi:cyclic pyranopterin monophosphate synthase MoaC [Ruminiclostridium cellulolyticum]|uniref:Cyclic pyranopterin monophosphate synthase n=1 Tax=Ruminiclostridium cellulolyticum (strain ATCC 35319 / DSM 5812 / JCM 6584 / H10) TaxID=394503 RepID=B8I2G2_RUMCH|nr:molybdenum cofactor biosynthesis protein C [Ruminiclostridium cellulolyticum H10]
MIEELSHLDTEGRAKMVDVSFKEPTCREASAQASLEMSEELLELVKLNKIAKGDIFSVSKCAGIMAAKQTSMLIPLCHQIPLDKVELDFQIENNRIVIKTFARAYSKTGVEMEALTAASIAALTIYDMCKAVDKSIIISEIKLLKKAGGKSGEFFRENLSR